MSDGFASVEPDGPLYRLGRYPDPWAWPDWSYAAPDGTFGNRYDDPQASYRVLYASSQRVGAFLETLARFRPDLEVLAELDRIEGDDEPPPAVPRSWLDKRLIGDARVEGRFVDVGDTTSLATLRMALAAPRFITGSTRSTRRRSVSVRRVPSQQVSRYVYEQGDPFAGIRYRSRLGDDIVNWAIFEPAPDGRAHSSRRPLRRSKRTILICARRSDCSASPSRLTRGSGRRRHRRACRQRRRGIVQLVLGDVGVAADGRKVGVAEVGGDEAGVARLLPQPGRGGVAERVRGDALLDLGSLGGAADDPGEDRRLQPLALEPAEDRCVRGRAPVGAEERELAGERRCERLAARLAALAAADEQRRPRSLELEVSPVERDQLRPAQARLDEREQDEPVTLGEARAPPRRVLGRGEEAGELLLGQPVRLLLRLRRRLRARGTGRAFRFAG